MNLITNEDTDVYPYNDNDMVYDLDTRQYLLTIGGVSKHLDENLETLLGTIKKADIFLLEISDIIYNHIYSRIQIQILPHKRHQIAKDENIRPLFKRILLAQIRYSIRSGANLLGDMHGVNIEKGKALPIASLRGRVEISSQALRMLSQSGLLYSGYQFSYVIDEDGSF